MIRSVTSCKDAKCSVCNHTFVNVTTRMLYEWRINPDFTLKLFVFLSLVIFIETYLCVWNMVEFLDNGRDDSLFTGIASTLLAVGALIVTLLTCWMRPPLIQFKHAEAEFKDMEV